MPNITVNGETFEAPEGKRLVLAIEDHGTPIGHRCGGYAKCTTCRVEFEEGEPGTMTAAEYERLKARGLYGEVRLSCQIVCDHDMSVRPVMTAGNQPKWDGDTGPAPEAEVTPEAEWFPISELEKGEA